MRKTLSCWIMNHESWPISLALVHFFIRSLFWTVVYTVVYIFVWYICVCGEWWMPLAVSVLCLAVSSLVVISYLAELICVDYSCDSHNTRASLYFVAVRYIIDLVNFPSIEIECIPHTMRQMRVNIHSEKSQIKYRGKTK